MAQAREGDTVKVHYRGTLDDGSVFDSSEDHEPLQFRVGEGNVIPGFERAVIGMSPGDTKTERISADEAYGEHRDEMMLEVDRSTVPPELDPQIGDWLEIALPNGATAPVRVTSVSDSAIVLDANHPLAGRDLTFEISLVEIEHPV